MLFFTSEQGSSFFFFICEVVKIIQLGSYLSNKEKEKKKMLPTNKFDTILLITYTFTLKFDHI